MSCFQLANSILSFLDNDVGQITQYLMFINDFYLDFESLTFSMKNIVFITKLIVDFQIQYYYTPKISRLILDFTITF